MDSKREIYRALLEGEKLEYGREFYIYMNDLGELVDDEGDIIDFSFDDYENWSIYRELTWYDMAIPQPGILCWVNDIGESNLSYPMLVIRKDRNDTEMGFEAEDGNMWDFALPLTKAEIQVYMNNVPESI